MFRLRLGCVDVSQVDSFVVALVCEDIRVHRHIDIFFSQQTSCTLINTNDVFAVRRHSYDTQQSQNNTAINVVCMT